MDIVNAWQVDMDDSEFVIISIRKSTDTPLPGLTVTERKIAERLLLGESNKEIAMSRGTSVRTVANQVASIFRKLDLSSRAELSAYVTYTQLNDTIAPLASKSVSPELTAALTQRWDATGPGDDPYAEPGEHGEVSAAPLVPELDTQHSPGGDAPVAQHEPHDGADTPTQQPDQLTTADVDTGEVDHETK